MYYVYERKDMNCNNATEQLNHEVQKHLLQCACDTERGSLLVARVLKSLWQSVERCSAWAWHEGAFSDGHIFINYLA